jgi:hypothetical protein
VERGGRRDKAAIASKPRREEKRKEKPIHPLYARVRWSTEIRNTE